MKPLWNFSLTIGLLLVAGNAPAFDLTPVMPLQYRNSTSKIVEVVCKYNEEKMWTIRLPDGARFTPESPLSLLITPAVERSSIRITIAKLDGLPKDFESKEALEYYDQFVKANVPDSAKDIGQLKRAGTFASKAGVLSDSFGLVYTFSLQKFAIGCGFINLPELGVQIRYTLNAPVESFEELHRYIRYELSDLRTMTPAEVRKLNGTTLPE